MARVHNTWNVIGAIGGVYIAQSVIGGITWAGLPGILRAQNLPLDQIGLVSLLVLPWALKFLWAPKVERFRLPDGGRDRSARIVLLGAAVVVAALVVVGLIGPFPVLPVLGVLMIAAFATATVDISCDGYAVEALKDTNYGWGNAAQVGGAYLGGAIGGGIFLILVDRAGWTSAVWMMALLIVALCIPFALIARTRETFLRPHQPSLKAALERPEVRKGLMIAALYVVAQKSAMGMFGPYFLDAGYDLGQLGILSGVGSLTLGFLGAIVGGATVRRFGTRAVLIGAVVLQSGLLALVALSAGDTIVPAATVAPVAMVASAAVMAFGFVALYGQFMNWSDPRQGGVDFTLFQCADAAISMVSGVAAGFIAEHFGYGVFFALACSVSLMSLPFIARIAAKKVTHHG
jgi:MFS transporter (putative signal transducer)